MQFNHRVRALWSWLPAFRAVAETEHLPTAARELDLAPSSLSRAIKLLEEELGVPLFDHGGKTLVLNAAGRALLAEVRTAMRGLDDVIGAVAGNTMAGHVTAATGPGVPPALLAPVCALLHARHPELRLAVTALTILNGSLHSGEVDAAIVTHAPHDPELAIVELPARTRRAFAAVRPAAGAPLRCVVVGTRGQPVNDGWPAEVPREIAMWVSDEAAAVAIARASDLVVVAGRADELMPLGDLAIAPQPLFVATRRPLGPHPRTEALLAAIRDALARCA